MAMFDKRPPAAPGGTETGFGRKQYGGAPAAAPAPGGTSGTPAYPAPPAAGQPAPPQGAPQGRDAADIATVTLLFKSKTSESYSAVVKPDRHQELMELLNQIQPNDRIGVSPSTKHQGTLSLWIMRPKGGG